MRIQYFGGTSLKDPQLNIQGFINIVWGFKNIIHSSIKFHCSWLHQICSRFYKHNSITKCSWDYELCSWLLRTSLFHKQFSLFHEHFSCGFINVAHDSIIFLIVPPTFLHCCIDIVHGSITKCSTFHQMFIVPLILFMVFYLLVVPQKLCIVPLANVVFS